MHDFSDDTGVPMEPALPAAPSRSWLPMAMALGVVMAIIVAILTMV
ncbi:MAG TPA: hypothetical protein PK691_05815 [Thermomicrobiales bacterium]|nr:hypothetical protein [Thermomicrobiales bacterium]HRA47202.1 hypothetical protein [Thermomicrobiales bacterium]